MKDLSLEFKSKLQKLFIEKKFSNLEFELESLGNIRELPNNIRYLYAISKSLNLKSKKSDLELAVSLITDIYLENKKNLEPLYNLIVVSLKAEKYKKTIEILKEALEENPKDEKIIDGLGKLNYVLANIDESYKFYKLLFEINPEQILSRQTFLTLLNYHPNISQKEYLLECKKYCKIIEKDVNFEFNYKKDKSHKIKIGFLSSDFKKHSVSYFLKSLLKNLDKNQFEITAFSNLKISYHDQITLELKKNFDYWYDVTIYPDSDLIHFIRKKNIDIIIDLNGYTFGNRFHIFANRVAPIQMLWLGYCNSTALKNMDFLISDKNCIKKDEEKLYTEKIIYLENIWNTMYLPNSLPDIKDLPYNTDKVFTFGSFNNFQKISSKTILIWSKILNNTNSRILLKNSIMDNEEINLNLKEKFLKNNVREDKICILNFKKNNFDHLSLYNQVDLALDTFPYNGVTTTFESLLMGVPVLSLKGFNFNSRCGESINRNLDLENFIAENEEDYYLKALNNFNNKEHLSELRKALRKKVMLSPLLNDKEFNKTFSENLKTIWKDFLASKFN